MILWRLIAGDMYELMSTSADMNYCSCDSQPSIAGSSSRFDNCVGVGYQGHVYDRHFCLNAQCGRLLDSYDAEGKFSVNSGPLFSTILLKAMLLMSGIFAKNSSQDLNKQQN